MAMPADPRGTVEQFAQTVMTGGPSELDLACISMAACFDDTVDVIGTLALLDEIAADVPSPTVDGLIGHLTGPQGFRGDTETYHDPVNSMLPAVLQRRAGMPITLAVVAIEVGRRIGVDICGVGMPAHFLICPADEPGRFVDMFGGGASLTPDGCRGLYRTITGDVTGWEDAWLEPVGNRAILTRILTNARASFVALADREGLRRVLQLRSCLQELEIEASRSLSVLQAPFN